MEDMEASGSAHMVTVDPDVADVWWHDFNVSSVFLERCILATTLDYLLVSFIQYRYGMANRCHLPGLRDTGSLYRRFENGRK